MPQQYFRPRLSAPLVLTIRSALNKAPRLHEFNTAMTGATRGEADEGYVEAARETYVVPSSGHGQQIQIDDDAVISEGEGGAWVMAWVWVPGAGK